MTETITVTKTRMTLSELLARHYRRVHPGIVGVTYALNQDLAREGPFLPVGRAITVLTPAEVKARKRSSDPVVDIFL